MDGLDYREDVRHTEPNENQERKLAFRRGWTHAVSETRGPYSDDALERLTWQNLGYRIGRILGDAPVEDRERMYELCVEIQAKQLTASTER